MNKLIYVLGILFLTLPILATPPTLELDQETPITLPEGAPKGVLIRVQGDTAEVFISQVASGSQDAIIAATTTGQAAKSFALSELNAGTGMEKSTTTLSELDANDSSSPAWFWVHYRGPRWSYGHSNWIFRGHVFPFRNTWVHRLPCCVHYFYRYMPW